MQAIPYIIMAVATAVSVSSAKQAARAQEENFKAQQSVNKYNAEVSRQQAGAANSESAAQQSVQNRRAAIALGEQRAAIAQSGTGFGGSNADLLERSQTLAELDTLNIAYSGSMKSRGYMQQANVDEFNSGLNTYNAGQAVVAGRNAVTKSLLSGASSAYGQYSAGAKK